MANEMDCLQEKWNPTIGKAIDNAADIITKSYLNRLEQYTLLKPTIQDLDIDVAECGKFFKLTKLAVNKEENLLHKLTTIVNVVSSVESSLATIIRSDGNCIEYYLGILSKENSNREKRRKADIQAFRGALEGNLLGSGLTEVTEGEWSALQEAIGGNRETCYSAISGLADLRDKENTNREGYVQGLENLVDSLKGQKYTIVMIADPVKSSELQVIKKGYEILHTQLSPFLKNAVTLSEGESRSVAKARTDGVMEGISTGIAMTQSRSRSTGNFTSGTLSVGVNVGFTASAGMTSGSNRGIADTSGRTETSMNMRQQNYSNTQTATASTTSGKSMQIQYENRSIKTLLDHIDKYLLRLEDCESYGAFSCAAYVITDSQEEAGAVAGNYLAIMRGQDSGIQTSHINTWYKPEHTEIMKQYLNAFVHPRFEQKGDAIVVTPASIVSGNEVAIQIGLPKKSIHGITVIPMAPFGRNVMRQSSHNLLLGNLYHMGQEEGGEVKQKVEIDIDSLSMHTFITGSTGSGKSTIIYSILNKLMRDTIKFMVIEPAKGEYKNQFPQAQVYGTNYKKMPLLRINPFSFPEDIHVLEHLDRLVEIFNACWPMYAAMPSVLKEAMERAYWNAGWDLNTSECSYEDSFGNKLFPNFVDVLTEINTVIEESQYSSDSKGDYKGALCTRIRSLTNGLYGQIFSSYELSFAELFDENVIVDLSRVGSMETKSLIMGILVMKLQEYRMSNARGNNAPLKHVTVLEEAHHLLKRSASGQNMESADLMGKAVEMLANSIAEMRTYGEGFIIADQAPGLLDLTVIRNTNTKIILRLPDYMDRELVGKAAGLNEEQINEVARLETFVGAVYQNNWLEPVLCAHDVQFTQQTYQYSGTAEPEVPGKEVFLSYLLMSLAERRQQDTKFIDALIDNVFKTAWNAGAKTAFLKFIQATAKEQIQEYRAKAMYGIFHSEQEFRMYEERESNIEVWYQSMSNVLETNLTQFNQEQQRMILAILVKYRADIDHNTRSIELFERLMEGKGR